MKTDSKLARVFKTLAAAEQQTESTAASILAIVKQAKATTLGAFNALVKSAYEANGWNTRPGRPNGDEDHKGAVPGTVRTYVTQVRQAIDANLKVAKFSTFYELRKALARKAARATSAAARSTGNGGNGHVIPEDVKNDFAGVNIADAQEPNGALMHDLAYTFLHLPKDQRPLFGRQLAKLLHTWQSKIPAARQSRKAA